MKTDRTFRILKSGGLWVLQELVVYKWWIFKTQKYIRIAVSVHGSNPLIEYTKNLMQPDGIVWESKTQEKLK